MLVIERQESNGDSEVMGVVTDLGGVGSAFENQDIMMGDRVVEVRDNGSVLCKDRSSREIVYFLTWWTLNSERHEDLTPEEVEELHTIVGQL